MPRPPEDEEQDQTEDYPFEVTASDHILDAVDDLVIHVDHRIQEIGALVRQVLLVAHMLSGVCLFYQ